jgi:hypothetical protein
LTLKNREKRGASFKKKNSVLRMEVEMEEDYEDKEEEKPTKEDSEDKEKSSEDDEDEE